MLTVTPRVAPHIVLCIFLHAGQDLAAGLLHVVVYLSLKDNRWTKRCTEWQPRRGKRTRGRPSRRWQDDITEKEGTTWIRKVTDRRRWKTLMEGYIVQWMDKA